VEQKRREERNNVRTKGTRRGINGESKREEKMKWEEKLETKQQEIKRSRTLRR
jgi:hypothetical protein